MASGTFQALTLSRFCGTYPGFYLDLDNPVCVAHRLSPVERVQRPEQHLGLLGTSSTAVGLFPHLLGALDLIHHVGHQLTLCSSHSLVSSFLVSSRLVRPSSGSLSSSLLASSPTSCSPSCECNLCFQEIPSQSDSTATSLVVLKARPPSASTTGTTRVHSPMASVVLPVSLFSARPSIPALNRLPWLVSWMILGQWST